MKSSSELFPVSLLRADAFSGLTEDVYLAVSHLGYQNKQHSGVPVILLHGSFNNRGFWLSGVGEGLARHLLDQGFDVWMMDMRGHGMSPRNQDYRNNTQERYALYDLPAVAEFVHEKSGKAPVWLGHSLGGVTIAAAVAGGLLRDEKCSGMVIIAAQAIRRPMYQWVPFASLAARTRVNMKGELDGRKLGLGQEAESAGIIDEYLARHSLFGAWQLASTQQKLLPAWKDGTPVPLLALAGEADRSEPVEYCSRFAALYGGDKTFIPLGTGSGLSQDYGHLDMMSGQTAGKEVWPQISDWLKATIEA